VRLGGLDAVVAGEGDGPAVVLCHGFGAPAEDLVPLARLLDAPAGTRFVFPAAPLELGLPFSDARAWWMIDLGRYERDIREGRGATWTREVPAGLAAARERLVALVEELAPRRLILGGFSQGAMLACDVALRTQIPLAGLVLLSGAIVAEDEWAPRFAARRGLPVFMSHGTGDPLLPYVVAERLRLFFEDAGADVTFEGFRGGHELPPAVMNGLGAFLRLHVAGRP
jgi:phospholipase/carboxylesterase